MASLSQHTASAVLLLAVVAPLALSLTATQGKPLLCYNCQLEPGRNDCINARQLQEARMTYQTSLDNNLTVQQSHDKVKDLVSICPDSMSYCVIERLIRPNQLPLMYRDCSDGVHFATNTNGTRIDHPPADNNTHCAMPALTETGMLCVTLCDSSFCNGPDSGAPTRCGAGAMLVLSVLSSLTSALWLRYVRVPL